MGTEESLLSHSIPQSCALEFISPPRPARARALSVEVAQIEFSEHVKEMAVLGEEPGASSTELSWPPRCLQIPTRSLIATARINSTRFCSKARLPPSHTTADFKDFCTQSSRTRSRSFLSGTPKEAGGCCPCWSSWISVSPGAAAEYCWV